MRTAERLDVSMPRAVAEGDADPFDEFPPPHGEAFRPLRLPLRLTPRQRCRDPFGVRLGQLRHVCQTKCLGQRVLS